MLKPQLEVQSFAFFSQYRSDMLVHQYDRKFIFFTQKYCFYSRDDVAMNEIYAWISDMKLIQFVDYRFILLHNAIFVSYSAMFMPFWDKPSNIKSTNPVNVPTIYNVKIACEINTSCQLKFCLFVVLRPTQEIFTYVVMSPLSVKVFRFWPILGTHGSWAVRAL